MAQWTPHPDTYKPVRYKGYFGPLLDGPGNIRAPEGRMQPPWRINGGYMPEVGLLRVDENLQPLSDDSDLTIAQRTQLPQHYLWREEPPEYDFLRNGFSERLVQLIQAMAPDAQFTEIFHYRPNGERVKTRYFDIKAIDHPSNLQYTKIECVVIEFSAGGGLRKDMRGNPVATFKHPLLLAEAIKDRNFFGATNIGGIRGAGGFSSPTLWFKKLCGAASHFHTVSRLATVCMTVGTS